MSKKIDCNNCFGAVDINNEPLLCHVCPKGHVLCENCNDIARDYCFQCGGRTTRKLPEKEIKELFKICHGTFMKKITESSSLIIPEEHEMHMKPTKNTPPTVIGFKKWPRSFFHQIPDENCTLSYNDQQFLEILPNIIEDEEPPKVETAETCWESLPKSFTDFKTSCDIMKCPITRCGYPICNSDATHHLLQSHENILIEVLERFSIGTFKMNTLYVRKNEIRTLMRILLPGVIKDLGMTKYKDHLPFYLLYTRVNILEAEAEFQETERAGAISGQLNHPTLDNSNDFDYLVHNPWRNTDCLLIWCAGIVLLDHTITVAISVYPSDDELMNLGALVKVLSLHMPQNGNAIFRSTERLMITSNDLRRLIDAKATFEGQIRIM